MKSGDVAVISTPIEVKYINFTKPRLVLRFCMRTFNHNGQNLRDGVAIVPGTSNCPCLE